ncbi:MAG: aldo/keto reductase [Polyangiales bacterium]
MTTPRPVSTVTLGGDLIVNRLGFGAMRITGDGIWGEPRDAAEAKRVLLRAVELGVQLIDTADSYGPDVSERLIGETLAPYRHGVVIATKGGLTRSGPSSWERDGRPEHLRAAIDGSLRRLRVDRIDLYQLHAADPKVPFEASVGTLAALQREGKIRHIGLSNVSVAQLAAARAIVPIVSVQNRYGLHDRGSDDVLDACTREGIAFLPYFPLAAGKATVATGVLKQIADAHGCKPGQVALAWLLARSPIMVPIPGTSKVAHLEENVASSDIVLTEQERRALEA